MTAALKGYPGKQRMTIHRKQEPLKPTRQMTWFVLFMLTSPQHIMLFLPSFTAKTAHDLGAARRMDLASNLASRLVRSITLFYGYNAGYKTKYIELLYAFICTILQEQKSTGTAVHQQKNSGFDLLCECKSHLILTFRPRELARLPCIFRTRHIIHRVKNGPEQPKQGSIQPLSYDSLSCPTDSIYRYRHSTEMQVWLWRTQSAFVLCFKGHC